MVIVPMILGFPAVKAQLKEYKQLLQRNPGPLARQALDSIRDKEFHCLGGSVYVLLAGKELRKKVLQFIVAFQTISDYLDNLCDRFGIHSEPVFRQLHTAMLDSLNPGAREYSDYYALFPVQQDGGYLQRLVRDCRRALRGIPAYPQCREYAENLTKLYIDLQSYKHMERKAGEESLVNLCERNRNLAPGLYWWEFAAACGSTLGVFTIVASGRNAGALFRAYMPWVNGLHILLDYLIDQEEDAEHDDMNLVAYYTGQKDQTERLLWFYRQAQSAVTELENSSFHALVIDGLLALYLSDAKARSFNLAGVSSKILGRAGLRARVLERMARVLRIGGII